MDINTCNPEKLSFYEKIELVRKTDGLLIDILEGETIEGSLSLSGCTSLIHLPENLKVEVSLWLWSCISLTHLPDNLKVGGNLYLKGCTSLKSIPDSIEVGGEIFLPDHLKRKTGRKRK